MTEQSPSPAPETPTAAKPAAETPAPDAADVDGAPQATAVFVSRSRSLNLGGLVVIALVIGTVAGLVWGLVQGVQGAGLLVLGALYGTLFIGGGLALAVVIVDWVLERARSRR